MTANQRYAQASFEVANLYIISEDYCGAIPYFNQGLPISASESIQMTATAVYLQCYPPADVPASPSDSGSSTEEENYYNPETEDFYFAG